MTQHQPIYEKATGNTVAPRDETTTLIIREKYNTKIVKALDGSLAIEPLHPLSHPLGRAGNQRFKLLLRMLSEHPAPAKEPFPSILESAEQERREARKGAIKKELATGAIVEATQ
jgi:hypothetical protein